MQRVIIDTNVLVSALIQRRYAYLLFYTFFTDKKLELCLSEELIKEYHNVLLRPRFARHQDFLQNANAILVDIESKALFFIPTIRVQSISESSGNKILELAEECTADFIITGNTNDFAFPSYNRTRIVSPREYWDDHNPH